MPQRRPVGARILWIRRMRHAVAAFSGRNWPKLSAVWHAGRVTASASRRSWLETSLGWTALAVPLLLTLARASSAAQWRGDLATVRGLGLIPVGIEGTVSTVMAQACALLPIGSRHLRLAVASALALSIASRLLYALCLRLLRTSGVGPRLTPALALAGALLVALSPTWQLEGTIAGGATTAAALGLGTLILRPSATVRDARIWLGYGALLGLTLAESPSLGLAVCAGLVAQSFALGGPGLPVGMERRSIIRFMVGLGGAALLTVTPMLLRPISERAGLHLGLDIRTAGLTALDVGAQRVGALAAWQQDIGIASIVLAVVGGTAGLLKRGSRWLAAPLIALVLADAMFPAARTGIVAADPLAGLRLLAIAALGTLALFGVATLVELLQKAELPLARISAALVAGFAFALVLLSNERSSVVANRAEQRGAAVWTDHALGKLPPRSLLLVRSPAVAWRLWSARVVGGERPDIVVVPVGMLNRGSMSSELLQNEPALDGLIRDVAITGRPGEYALSTLADARPVYVELDPGWDRRLMDHLVPEPMWLAFAPTALGKSDRVASLRRGREAFHEVLEAAEAPTRRDDATLAMLSARAQDQAVALAAIGDRQSAQLLMSDLVRLDPSDRVAKIMSDRFASKARGSIDARDLLR